MSSPLDYAIELGFPFGVRRYSEYSEYSDGPFVSSSPAAEDSEDQDLWADDSADIDISQSIDDSEGEDHLSSVPSSPLASAPARPQSLSSSPASPQPPPLYEDPAHLANRPERPLGLQAPTARGPPSQRSSSHDIFIRHIEAQQRERISRDRQHLLRSYRAAREALRDRRERLAALQAAFAVESEVELDFQEIDNDFDPLDELFEMEVDEAPRSASRRRRQPQAAFQAPLPEVQRPQQRDPAVIDLTEEPDSPVLTFQPLTLPRTNSNPHSQQSMSRNPRRQMSLNHRTPSLARSDGSVLGGNAPAAVIDLTGDSPDEPAPNNQRESRFPRRAREESGADRLRAEVSFFAQLGIIRQRFNRALPHIFGAHQPIDAEVQFIGQNTIHMDPLNPLADNPVHFNYRANGFGGFDGGRPATPKPAHVPPPPAREGFTRKTGEDLAFVCPSCDEELKYNEDETEEPPAKKARTRKDREEHHFWAVKNCGHVYCKKCFDNRRGGPKVAQQPTFRKDQSKNTKLFCAVEDCDSEVSRKDAWVGIFL